MRLNFISQRLIMRTLKLFVNDRLGLGGNAVRFRNVCGCTVSRYDTVMNEGRVHVKINSHFTFGNSKADHN